MEYIGWPFIDVPFEDILATFRNEYRNMGWDRRRFRG